MGRGMNTYSTQLAYAAKPDEGGAALVATAFKRVVRIKDYGDLMGTPEPLDTTDLEDGMSTNTPGIKQTDSLEFTFNYTKENYDAAKKLDDDGEHVFALHFNGKFESTANDAAVKTEGTDGAFYFIGQLSVGISGAGVNEVREGTITISQSSEVYDSLAELNSAMGWK